MASEETPNDKKSEGAWHPIWVLIGVSLVLIAAVYVYLLAAFPDPVVYVVSASNGSETEKNEVTTTAQNSYRAARAAQWGQIGDTVGGLLNPVLTFFSCIGLLVTIWLSMRALKESREHAAEQQRLERLSTMIAALTALHQAASFDYEHSKAAAGAGAAPAAEAARQRQQDVAGLLQDYYIELHKLTSPTVPIPKSMKSRGHGSSLDRLKKMLGGGLFSGVFGGRS